MVVCVRPTVAPERSPTARPNREDVERLVEEIARASEMWLAKQDDAGAEEDNTEDDDDAQLRSEV